MSKRVDIILDDEYLKIARIHAAKLGISRRKFLRICMEVVLTRIKNRDTIITIDDVENN